MFQESLIKSLTNQIIGLPLQVQVQISKNPRLVKVHVNFNNCKRSASTLSTQHTSFKKRNKSNSSAPPTSKNTKNCRVVLNVHRSLDLVPIARSFPHPPVR